MPETEPLPETFADFLAHWRALKRDARAPSLSDFLDFPNPTWQPWITIFDVQGESVVTRLFGTNMVHFTGNDFTGKSLDEFTAPEGRAGLRLPYPELVKRPCGTRTSSLWHASSGRTIGMRSIGLPLFRKNGASVAWLSEVTEPLSLGETAVNIRRRASLQWIDLGYGVPD